MLQALIGPVSALLDKFIEDKDQKNALAHEISTLASKQATELAKGQLAVNAVEAAHKSLFVAGWRPFTGWVCGVSLAYHFILAPLIEWILVLSGNTLDLPEFDFSQLSTIVMGMLGLAGARSYEKTKGVSREK